MNTTLRFKNQVVYEYDPTLLLPSDCAYDDHLSDNRTVPFQECVFRPGDTVYDIGAFIGTHAIRMALLGGVVHAFEGSPINVARLAKIFAPFRQITLHGVALGDTNETRHVRFNDCINHALQEVRFVRFDDLHLPLPAFVKLDIEGWETRALFQMKKLLAARPCWQVDWHRGLRVPGVDGFLEPENGGFNPIEFERQDYCILDTHYRPVPSFAMAFGCYYLVPSEKMHLIASLTR